MMKLHSVAILFFDRVVLQYPKVIILLLLLLVGLCGFGVRRFGLDASAETLVLQNDDDLRYSRLIHSRYGQQDFLILAYTPKGDLLSDKTLADMARLKEDLNSLERVVSVLSILDVPLVESPPISLKDLTGELPTLGWPTVDRDLARKELRTSSLYRNMLICPEGKTTALLINFAKDEVYSQLLSHRNELKQKKYSGSLVGSEIDELKRIQGQFREHRAKWRKERHQDIIAIRKIMDNYRSDRDLFLGGVSMVADDMISFIKSDLKVFGLGVLFLLLVMLGILFGKVRWIIFPTLCCTASAVSMIGLLGWFGWEVTVVSANFISLQLIMTMAIAIHLIVRYREELSRNPNADNRQLILETVTIKLRPCVYAVLTTIAGFGSLVCCDILPVITFGWMMIAGLIVSLILTFLLFPAVLVLLNKEAPSKASRWRFSLTSILAGITESHGVLIVVISGLVLVLTVIGMSKLKVENCFIDYFKESTEIHQGMKVIDQCLGGTTPLDVVVDFGQDEPSSAEIETDIVESNDALSDFEDFEDLDDEDSDDKYWFTAEKMDHIKSVHSYLDNLKETGKVLSLATMLSIVEKLNDDKALDSLELALLYSKTPDDFKSLLISPYVSVEHNQVRFWVRVRDSEKSLRRNELLKKIKSDLTSMLGIDEQRVRLAGMMVLYNNMLQSLFGSQILTLGITVLILTGMFLVLFRSLKIALIAMLPNVFSVGVVLGVMGWLDIPLDMMTITIAAIGVGIAVDDTIHYIHRFKQEFQEDRNYINTMHRCHGSIGHAMYDTSVTIIIGFSILAMSNFIPSVYFGLLTGLAMLIALIAALTLLPQMLILGKAFGRET